MLPPKELYLGQTHGTKWLMPLNAAVGYAATFGAVWLLARRQRPQWSPVAQALLAAGWFVTFEAAYTWHTIGHILSAKSVNAPMHMVNLRWSTQLNIYLKDNVSPHQHLGRAIGGPAASAVGLATGYGVWRAVRHIPLLGGLAQAWYVAHLVMVVLGLMPSPHFDGAALIKWWTTLRTGDEGLGEEALQLAGWASVAGCAAATLMLLTRRQWLWAVGAVLLGGYMILDLVVLRGRL
jgi:hypothetical protein